jgi:hypothetical protein
VPRIMASAWLLIATVRTAEGWSLTDVLGALLLAAAAVIAVVAALIRVTRRR